MVFTTLTALAGPAAAHQFLDYFETGSSQLSPRGYRVAREVVAYAAQRPSKILITAHEDGFEAATRANEKLDLWRAREMMLELMRLGMSPDMISVAAKGASQPALVRAAGVAEPLNRRLTVDVIRLQPPIAQAPRADLPGAPSPPLPLAMQITEPYRPWIPFPSGEVRLTREDEYRLRVGTYGFTPGECRIIVRGHTDTVGTREANLVLSRQRAEAVARALVRQGMLWEDIEVVASGETQLARASADEVAEQTNRRVTVDIFPKAGPR